MLRIRLLAAVAGALVAGLSVATVAGAARSEDDERPKTRTHAFGAGTFGPACWDTIHVPFCPPFSYEFRMLGVRRANGRAWGVFERRNRNTGFVHTGRVTCMSVEGSRAAIGGRLSLSHPQFPGEPFIIWVEDNGPLGSPTPDRISALGILPEGDPDLPLMPERFPRVCPSPESLYGYAPLTAGDITVVG